MIVSFVIVTPSRVIVRVTKPPWFVLTLKTMVSGWLSSLGIVKFISAEWLDSQPGQGEEGSVGKKKPNEERQVFLERVAE